jgi:hypothetical protein
MNINKQTIEKKSAKIGIRTLDTPLIHFKGGISFLFLVKKM